MNNELMKLIKSVQPTGRMGNNNEPVWNAEKVYGLMVKAQQQVNSVDLADVVGQSEQLKPNGSYYTECECGNLVHAREKNCKKCWL